MTFLNNLNDKQKEAVQHSGGPVLVLAGAGSGKTRVLTYRLAYLVEKGVLPQNILAVTFTNKAANEMKTRVKDLVADQTGSSFNFPFLGTFHSVACRILRKELDQSTLPYSSDFAIYDQDDSQSLIREIIKDKNLDKDQFKARKVLYLISSSKQDGLYPDQLVEDEYFVSQVKPIYKEYQQRMIESNAMDFDDLLMVPVKLFSDNKDLRDKYKNLFEHILIDEYQDTNQIQYQLIKILGGKEPNLMVVGDDWQSIYGFRGADFRNILNFKNDYKQVREIKLEQNYRSTKNIVESAQKLIENNSQRSEKQLWTDKGEGDKIGFIQAKTAEQESRAIAKMVEELADYSQTALLYRTHAQSRLLEEAFLHKQIPYQIIGGVRFYQRKEVKDIIAYLALVGSSSVVHLRRAINTPRRGIGKVTQDNLKQNNWQLDSLDHKGVNQFSQLVSDLEELSTKKTVDELIGWLVNKLNYRHYLIDYSDNEEQATYRWENIEELQSVAQRYSDLSPQDSLKAFLEEVALMDNQDAMEESDESITLMTLHNAKGLEFDNVFITGMEEGIFPHQRSLDSSYELEEERRLCYVGMTRAKKRLYLSWAESRTIHGQLKIQEKSSFLSEIPENKIRQVSLSFENSLSGQTQSADGDLKPGDWIKHLQLGRARIIKIDEDIVEVYFPELGKKTLSLEYAPIKKIK